MTKNHLILSQHQCDLLLHLPVYHLPVHHLPIHHLPQHHTSAMSSEMKENRKYCVRNMLIIALVWAFQST